MGVCIFGCYLQFVFEYIELKSGVVQGGKCVELNCDIGFVDFVGGVYFGFVQFEVFDVVQFGGGQCGYCNFWVVGGNQENGCIGIGFGGYQKCVGYWVVFDLGVCVGEVVVMFGVGGLYWIFVYFIVEGDGEDLIVGDC